LVCLLCDARAARDDAHNQLATVTADRDKLRGIIYRSTCDRLNGEDAASMLTSEDINDSLEVFYAMQKGIK
jgi:hypothetical protein